MILYFIAGIVFTVVAEVVALFIIIRKQEKRYEEMKDLTTESDLYEYRRRN